MNTMPDPTCPACGDECVTQVFEDVLLFRCLRCEQKEVQQREAEQQKLAAWNVWAGGGARLREQAAALGATAAKETEEIKGRVLEQQIRDWVASAEGQAAIKESQRKAAATVEQFHKASRICDCQRLGLNHGPWCHGYEP